MDEGTQTTPAPLPPPGRMRYAASAGVRLGPDPNTMYILILSDIIIVSGQATVPLNPRQLHLELHPNRKFPGAFFIAPNLSSPL